MSCPKFVASAVIFSAYDYVPCILYSLLSLPTNAQYICIYIYTHTQTDTNVKVKVKVKFTLEQTTKTHRGSRGTDMLFL